jgi:Domain of unknown function (DUF4062)
LTVAPEALLIDRAGSARRLDEADIRSWATDQRVFVSSVMRDYGEQRLAAARAIEAVGAEPVMFERFGGRDSDPEAAYTAEVESSSIYVGLLGERYGNLLPSRFSASHAEYLCAEQSGLRLSVWHEVGGELEGRQQSFLDEVETFNVTGRFADCEQLEQGLEARLRGIAAEDLSPWVKVGRTLFRAREIELREGQVTIRATLRGHDVADRLAALNDGFGSTNTTFAFWDGVYDARVKSISSVTRAGGSRDIEVEMEISPPQRRTEYGLNGVQYEDGTKLAVEVSWLGAANPLGMMASEAEIENPFTELAELGVSEEAYRPIAFVLAYEVLARQRNVGRLR